MFNFLNYNMQQENLNVDILNINTAIYIKINKLEMLINNLDLQLKNLNERFEILNQHYDLQEKRRLNKNLRKFYIIQNNKNKHKRTNSIENYQTSTNNENTKIISSTKFLATNFFYRFNYHPIKFVANNSNKYL